MFTRQCTACTRRQLIFPSQLLGLETTAHGVAVSYRCWCGAEQRFETAHIDEAMPTVAA